MTDQPETKKSTPRRRRAFAAPLVIVAAGGLAAGCSSSAGNHPLGVPTTAAPTSTTLHIMTGLAPTHTGTAPDIGDSCGDAVVLGYCIQTSPNRNPDAIIATGTYVVTTIPAR